MPTQLTPALIRLCIALLAACLAACSFLDDEAPEDNAEQLYADAKSALSYENYTDAIEKYELLETKFPFGRRAKQSMLESAYAHYKNYEYPVAIEKLDFFIKQYPGDPNTAYAHYLKALASYRSGESLVHNVLNFDRTDKDAQFLVDSFRAFSVVVKQHPDSPYAADARRRLSIIRNLLAVHELKIADYYFRRKIYLAALNRTKYILEHYTGAKHIPHSLLLMAESYRRIGRRDLARDVHRVMKLNYPQFTRRRLDSKGLVVIEPEKSWYEELNDLGDAIMKTARKIY